MENAEEILHFLEEFSKRKTRTIPQELNEYLAYVARTGDPVYQWSLVKSLFKEKLLTVITDFYETSPGIDIPPYPNVDPFNYDTMKNSLIERLDSFTAAPFTVQRICELLTYPRKQYNRIDKFMRAIEKNILVVSTREPGMQRHNIEPENGEPTEPIVNGSDNNSDYNVDVEMEDMSWKENSVQQQTIGPQPGSSELHISIDDVESHLQTKHDVPASSPEKTPIEYESLTPPEPCNDPLQEPKGVEDKSPESTTLSSEVSEKIENEIISTKEVQEDNTKEQLSVSKLIIPEIKIDDTEMTEQKLNEESATLITEVEKQEEPHVIIDEDIKQNNEKVPTESCQPVNTIDENSSDSNSKEEIEPKLFSEVSTSSEESSSSSENIDGNSNSPITDNERQAEIHTDQTQESSNSDSQNSIEELKQSQNENESNNDSEIVSEKNASKITLESDNYSISDVNSILPQPPNKMESTESIPEIQSEPTTESENTGEQKIESTDMTVIEKNI